MFYLCSENKGPDQMLGNRTADLHLSFCIMQEAGFVMTRLVCKLQASVQANLSLMYTIAIIYVFP